MTIFDNTCYTYASTAGQACSELVQHCFIKSLNPTSLPVSENAKVADSV